MALAFDHHLRRQYPTRHNEPIFNNNNNTNRRRRKRRRPFLRRINCKRAVIQILITAVVTVVLGPMQLDFLFPSPISDAERNLGAPRPLQSPLQAQEDFDWIRSHSRSSGGTIGLLPPPSSQQQQQQQQQPEQQAAKMANRMDKTLATPIQLSRLGSFENADSFSEALEQMQSADFRRRVDPLSENNFIQANPSNRIAFHPKSKYLGILVDAGRHYYPIDWLRRLIHYLHRLRFNMIHLRLTDDQAFNIQLESYPQLTLASSTTDANNATYTARELRDLVVYAKEYDIIIIPEINLPGHAGAWSGIPEMILQCPKFACELGYGIPMNVEYDQMKTILKGVLREVLDIFDNPPFLHLGGDEVHKSIGCFDELGLEPFQYDAFEIELKDVLREIEYPEDQVIRWEVTGPKVSEVHERAGNIQHNWYYLPGEKLQLHPDHTYFNSWRLYMDANDDEGAAEIFRHTLHNFQLHKSGTDHIPAAILPAAFELDTDLWVQRNVAARLIAVAMGAAQSNLNGGAQEVLDVYHRTCREMGLHSKVCDLRGFTAVPNVQYRKNWKRIWDQWIKGTCDRISGIDTM